MLSQSGVVTSSNSGTRSEGKHAVSWSVSGIPNLCNQAVLVEFGPPDRGSDSREGDPDRGDTFLVAAC